MKLLEELAQLPPSIRHQATAIFHNAYDEHKNIHGSFKDLQGEEYIKRMNERYNYMFQKAMEFVDGYKHQQEARG